MSLPQAVLNSDPASSATLSTRSNLLAIAINAHDRAGARLRYRLAGMPIR
jgi:hypothetical protein